MIIGVDYSTSSPAIAFDNLIIFANPSKKYCTTAKKDDITIIGRHADKSSDCQIKRFMNLASVLTSDWIGDVPPGVCAIENYAMGARGRLTTIAENTGIFKAVMVTKGWRIEPVTISVVKKHATGKGNAKKEQMADAWFEEHGWHLHDLIGCNKGESPAADCIDAWYVRKTYMSSIGE